MTIKTLYKDPMLDIPQQEKTTRNRSLNNVSTEGMILELVRCIPRAQEVMLVAKPTKFSGVEVRIGPANDGISKSHFP